ncbi:DUF3570 domain-containing protein [Chitinophaga agri]|uniref:DUF3570 domain-containing protein n=1 Tax=Chitinophaga agri TaxID=2703787 RepID=A0A6B9ZIY9_9BACT|nr:DUF3570 domain-containing protein [Chitinophaga agri]QHS62422.1 DUF3570 domain-containing protein [Chitinophaga agri]
MKRLFIAAGLLTAWFTASAQQGTDSSAYKKQQVSQTDIQVLFSFYTQDGNHSAVTGGTGTENLQVFATDVSITHQRDARNTFTVGAGIDMITSASTDNIDFVRSSASREDNRFHLNGGYSRQLNKPDIRVRINSGISLESDYLSVPLGVSAEHDNADHTRQWSVGLQCYFDDLRWGRFDPDYYHPETLVYPSELRDTAWFDIYRRQSYNVNMALYQVVNQRIQFAVFPEVVYQKGLLSTPFHRVYFTTQKSPRVENLPRERWKFPIGLQLNLFAGRNMIIRSYYRFYHDNFGITGHTFQLEVPVKADPQLTIAPLFRFYTQTGAKYFKPYKEHSLQELYYTSDYDLSRFNSYKAGITARYALFQPMFRHYSFREIGMRYAYYKRSDRLSAHTISLFLDFKHSKA